MHIETAFLSSTVAAASWTASAGGTAQALRSAGRAAFKPLPLALATAFVFAAQLPVFDVAVPGTGSSAHFGGGLLLSLLLGPAPAILALAVVLGLQVLLTGDGSWFTYGANLFNLAVLPALLVLPLFYRPLAQGASPARRRLLVLLAGLLAVLCGGLSQGLMAALSGTHALSAAAFFGQLLPLHTVAGLGEGLLSLLLLEALALSPLRAAQAA